MQKRIAAEKRMPMCMRCCMCMVFCAPIFDVFSSGAKLQCAA